MGRLFGNLRRGRVHQGRTRALGEHGRRLGERLQRVAETFGSSLELRFEISLFLGLLLGRLLRRLGRTVRPRRGAETKLLFRADVANARLFLFAQRERKLKLFRALLFTLAP